MLDLNKNKMTRGSSLETRITYGTCKQCLKLQYEHLTCEMKMNKMGEFAINFKPYFARPKMKRVVKGICKLEWIIFGVKVHLFSTLMD